MGNLGRLTKITQYYFMLLRNGLAGMEACSSRMPEVRRNESTKQQLENIHTFYDMNMFEFRRSILCKVVLQSFF